ncbi:MAG: hypothetical protein Ta2E_10570 [Mycoplasmoidaceae bacterium]|nr:MAG: hypothetical protein Ta2E_10570 [Mycoplasmoidaceae bacterium]
MISDYEVDNYEINNRLDNIVIPPDFASEISNINPSLATINQTLTNIQTIRIDSITPIYNLLQIDTFDSDSYQSGGRVYIYISLVLSGTITVGSDL